jgi:hypothetical protein
LNFNQIASGNLAAQLASRDLYFLSCGAREKMQTIPLISTPAYLRQNHLISFEIGWFLFLHIPAITENL